MKSHVDPLTRRLQVFTKDVTSGTQLAYIDQTRAEEILGAAARVGSLEGRNCVVTDRWLCSLAPTGPVLGADKV